MVTLKQGSPSPVLQLYDPVNLGCITSRTHLQLQESGSTGPKLGTLFQNIFSWFIFSLHLRMSSSKFQGAIKRYRALTKKVGI